MKKLAVIGLLLASFGLPHAQASDTYIQLSRDGDASPALRFGPTDMDGCRAAAPKIGMPGLYTCTWTYDASTAAPPAAVVVTKPATPVVTTGATDSCSTMYAGGLTLNTGRTLDAASSMIKPALGKPYKEPAYSTCVTRATDHAAVGVSGLLRNDYSRRQAFNSDSSKYLAYGMDGSWYAYSATTFAKVKDLPVGGNAEPQWDAINPDVLYFSAASGTTAKLNELTVSTGAVRVVGDFSARVKARWGANATAVSTKDEGSPSKDGRYWCFMVLDRVSNPSASWPQFGAFTWDKQTDTILGYLDFNGDGADHVSMSPTGNYCVVSRGGATGTRAYTRDFTSSVFVNSNSEHSDIALDADGNDVFVSIDYGPGDVFFTPLKTGVRTVLFNTYNGLGGTAMHFSGKGFNKPGWVVIGTYAPGGTAWFDDAVMAVQLKANPTIYRLAKNRVTYSGYWTEPHASVNRDFTKVVFNSNWGTGDENVDEYMIQLPAGAVK